MRKTIDKAAAAVAPVLIVLTGGLRCLRRTILTVLVVGFVLLLLAALFQAFGPAFPLLGELGAAFGVILFYAGVILAVGVGVVIALIQRWKEVKGGEEDEAKKY